MAPGVRSGHLLDDRAGLGRVRFEGAVVVPRLAATQELIAYYETHRSPEGWLSRGLVAPKDLAAVLPHLFMAERAGTDWRYRLLGTGLVRHLGVEVTGQPLRAIFEARTAGHIQALYDGVVDARRWLARRGRFFGVGPTVFATESVQFPMLGRDGRTMMVLGGVFLLDDAGAAPP